MKSRLLTDDQERTFALIFDAGDRVMQPLKQFAQSNRIKAARLTAIGAFQQVELGYFDIAAQEYRTRDFDTQLEVLSFVGDIGVGEESSIVVHAHVVLGREDFSALGGHLMEATVRPTLEVMLIESPARLQRRHDPASGLALISL